MANRDTIYKELIQLDWEVKDQDEFFDAVSVRRPDGVQRAEHVVADGLLGTGLHQRDMLMGGGVEHHVGLVGIKQQFQPPGVPDGADLHAEG